MKLTACILLMPFLATLTYKMGTINAYTLRNEKFHSSFYVTDDHASLNLSTTHHLEYDEPTGFNVNIALFDNGEAVVQYIDQDNKKHTASLLSIIQAANEFERTHATKH